jgi:hypothetical protein
LQFTARLIAVKLTEKTAADFRLSAFGLPEPIDFPAPAKSRWYLWVLGAAGVCGALAWFFRRRYRSGHARTVAHSFQDGGS